MSFWKNLENTFLGFFQDSNGKGSRKATTLYACLAFLGIVVIGEKSVSYEILGTLVIIILWCLGAITREHVGKLLDTKTPKVDGDVTS